AVTYPPGSVIVREGEDADRFYIITRGRVEILLQHPGGQEVLVDRLNSGQYFGEIGLLRGGKRTATVRAASDGPVEVMALNAGDFRSMISDSTTTREELHRTIQERLARPHAVG